MPVIRKGEAPATGPGGGKKTIDGSSGADGRMSPDAGWMSTTPAVALMMGSVIAAQIAVVVAAFEGETTHGAAVSGRERGAGSATPMAAATAAAAVAAVPIEAIGAVATAGATVVVESGGTHHHHHHHHIAGAGEAMKVKNASDHMTDAPLAGQRRRHQSEGEIRVAALILTGTAAVVAAWVAVYPQD